MKIHSEDLRLEFNKYEQLSYKDLNGKYYVELFLDNKSVGFIEVWTDVDNEEREYIIINYEMIYLDTLTDITK
jgi:hypothetical protein